MRIKPCIIVMIFLFGIMLQVFGDIPPGYYNQAEGAKKEQLKTAIHQIIKDATVLKYGGSGVGYTWEGFSRTDNAGGGVVFDRYSDIPRYFNGIRSVSGMHIEHSFANSWWGGVKNQAYRDIHHLYPADGTANILKSNNPIGVVNGEIKFDNGVTRVGMTTLDPEGTIKVWEPADEYKGDFARTYMYMATCYENYSDLWQKEGLLMLENNTYPVFKSWVMDLLLQWNRQDPVNDLEKERNETVFTIQGNRNPFIDYPELAEYIWGDKTESAFYTIDDEETPQIFTPSDQSVIDFGLQALSVPAMKIIKIRGRNLQNNLEISFSDGLFDSPKTTFTPQEVTDGYDLTLTGHTIEAGIKSSVMTLSFDGRTEQVTIIADFREGIPAYEGKDIVCTANSKTFVASWLLMPDIPTYMLDVYTKNDGVQKSLSGYPVEITGNQQQVKGLKAETTYYYKVTGGGMESNEVEVIMPKATPVFSVKNENLYFTTVPGKPSSGQKVELTILEMSPARAEVVVPDPFEVSLDGQGWVKELQLSGASPTFFIRMSAVEAEGVYEEEAILSAQDVEDIILTLVCDVDKNKPYFEDFEATSKGNYTDGTITLATGEWKFIQAGIYSLETDKKNRERSVRMRHNSGSFGTIEMLHDKENGADSLSFYAGAFSNDAAGSLSVEYSVNAGLDWLPVKGATNFAIQKEWTRYAFPLEVQGLVRVRIMKADNSSATTRRINIDDVTVSDYVAPSGINPVTGDADYKLYARKGKLHISSGGEYELSIYSLQGVLIHQKILSAGENKISLHSGAYVVKINGKSVVILL